MKIKDDYGDITIHTRKGSTTDEVVVDEIFKQNVYHLRDDMITDSGVVIDLGANIGAFTIEILRRAKHNGKPVTIYAIEPEPSNLEMLYKNIQANQHIIEDSKVIVVPLAIGGEAGTVKISDEHGGARVGDKGTEVQMITLDEFVKTQDITAIDLLKADTEGSELPTLLACSDETLDMIKYSAIEFDEYNGEGFEKLIKRFNRKCSFYTLGVPSRGCYLYTERHIK